MAIVKMNKFNLFSLDYDRKALLKRLQYFNQVHFNYLESSDEDQYIEKIDNLKELSAIDSKLAKAKWAIEVLEDYKQEETSALQELKEGKKSYSLAEINERAKEFDFNGEYKKLKKISDNKDKLVEKIEENRNLIEDLKPWKDLSIKVEDLESFKNVNIVKGNILTKYYDFLVEDLSSIDLVYMETISQDENLSYLVVVYDDQVKDEVEEILRKNIFTNIEIKTDGFVKDKIKKLEKETRKDIEETKIFNVKINSRMYLYEDFCIYYDYLNNKKNKILSENNFLKTSKVDIIEGYFPKDLEYEFSAVLDEELGDNYYLEIEEAQADDPKVPIKLKNNKFVSAFESLTEMYSMPKYNEVDPTPLFAPFYFVFAGIMVGDLGYGLLIFLGALIGLKKFNLDNKTKKFLKFFMYLGVSSAIWGFIFGSFFGDIVPMKAFIDPSTDYIEMILLSMILGGIHIFFALGIQGYMDIRDKKPLDALYDVGAWYMILTGAILAIVAANVATIPKIVFNGAIALMLLGMVIVLFTGGRQEKSIGGKIGWGIYSLYGITSYFGDFVSYIRLMALALSSAFIAIAVNIIVRMLVGNGALATVAGVLIFLAFQTFNIFLSFLSAYVHSARLTYVEMFNKFYEGGGIPFKEMVSKSNYFNIEEEN